MRVGGVKNLKLLRNMKTTIGILGQKLAMTQLPSGGGIYVPVTAVLVANNWVSQIKTGEKEGYNSCQLAFQDCANKSLNKSLLGHLNKQKISPKKYVREIRDMVGFETGSPLDVSLFQVGENGIWTKAEERSGSDLRCPEW